MCATVSSLSGSQRPHCALLSFHDLLLPYSCVVSALERRLYVKARGSRLPKGDINGTWQHDLFDGNKSLSARLSNSGAPPKMNASLAERALREANGETGLAIKGASSRGNVVEVSGLADGTTAEDVEVRFYVICTYALTAHPGFAGDFQALWTHHGPQICQAETGCRASRVQEREGRPGRCRQVPRPAR